MGWKELHHPLKKGTVLTKCHNTTKTKLLLMVFLKEMRKVKLNKHAFLTKIGLSYLPNLVSLCLDIHNHWILKKKFLFCKNPQKVTQIFKKLLSYYTWNHATELNSKNLTLNHYTKLYLLIFMKISQNRSLKNISHISVL